MMTIRFPTSQLSFRFLAAFFSLTILSAQHPVYAFLSVSQPSMIRAGMDTQGMRASGIPVESLAPQMLQQALAPIEEAEAIHAESTAAFRPYAFYFTQHHTPAIRIFKADGSYRAFELDHQGALGRVIETGQFANGFFSRARVYDYDHQTLTVYHATDTYQQKIYEINRIGEVGRPIQFRGREASGHLLNIRFLYNDESKTVTCLHLRDMHYAVYELKNHSIAGRLLEIGTALKVKNNGRLIPLTSVEITSIYRWRNEIPVYKFRFAGRDGFVIRERFAENDNPLGVMGRVLRFVSPEGDLEYFYEEGRLQPKPSVTIVDRRNGATLRLEIPRKNLDETHGRLDRQNSDSDTTLSSVLTNVKHFVMMAQAGFLLRRLQGGLVFFYSDSLFIREILGQLQRGPPIEGLML